MENNAIGTGIGFSMQAPEKSYRPGTACETALSDVQELILCVRCGELYGCEKYGNCNISKCTKSRIACLSGSFTYSYEGKCWKCEAKNKPQFAQ